MRIVLTGTGSYTVTGKGFRKSAQSSKAFKVAAGTYKVSAPGASVSRGSVKVKPGRKVTVTVAFPPAPVATEPPVVSPTQAPPPSDPTTPPVQTPPPSDPTTPAPPPADTTPPGKVTGLTVGTRTASSIALAWTNPGDADLAEIVVRRAQGATAPATPTAGTAVPLATVKATSVTDSGLTAGTTYSYAVFTRDASNNTNPAPTTVITSTSAVTDATPPGPVTSLSVGTRTTSRIGLSWTNPVDVDLAEVIVRRAVGATAPATPSSGDAVILDSLTASWVDDTGLTADTGYSYAVFTRDASNNISTPAVTVTARTAAPLPGGWTSKLVTADSAGTAGNAYSDFTNGVYSPDGSQVLFTSNASNLVPGDSNGVSDVFIKTLSSGAIRRVSVSSSGGQADDWSSDGQWSSDGSKVLFCSDATNLVPGVTDRGCYVKVLASEAIQWVGNTSNYYDATFSPDGTRVLFTSNDPALVSGDTNDTTDVFVRTLATGFVQRISLSSGGAQADSYSSTGGWAPDGNSVVFYSSATNLVPGDTNGEKDLFIKNLASGTVSRVSDTPEDGTVRLIGTTSARVLFVSDAADYGLDLLTYDRATGNVGQLVHHVSWGDNTVILSEDEASVSYVAYDDDGAFVASVRVATGVITRVSVDSNGDRFDVFGDSLTQVSPNGQRFLVRSGWPDGDNLLIKNLETGSVENVTDGIGFLQGRQPPNGFFSPDGQRVLFYSKKSLVPQDTNGTWDWYVASKP